MKTFTFPDGLTIMLDKVTHIEHLTKVGYKVDSPWIFNIFFVGGGHAHFPSAKDGSLHGLPGGKQGWRGFMFEQVDRVRSELVAALEGAPATKVSSDD